MQDIFVPDGTILIAPDEPTLRHYGKLLFDKYGWRFGSHQAFTLRDTRKLQGLRITTVYVARANQIQDPGAHSACMQIIIRSMAMTKDREGFFGVGEDGEIYASPEAV